MIVTLNVDTGPHKDDEEVVVYDLQAVGEMVGTVGSCTRHDDEEIVVYDLQAVKEMVVSVDYGPHHLYGEVEEVGVVAPVVAHYQRLRHPLDKKFNNERILKIFIK